MATNKTQVYLEVGKKRVFACAREWPGWCRSGRDEELALAALAEYAPRYAPVTREAGLEFSPDGFEVLERLAGSATTDFGAPGSIAPSDYQALTATESDRISALVAAAWAALDRIVRGAPTSLAKGPRGGGRDRDAVVEHVLGAETLYARKIGVRQRQPGADDAAGIAALRSAILEALRTGQEVARPGDKTWPRRYAARRIAWHVLDHAWEIEDRS